MRRHYRGGQRTLPALRLEFLGSTSLTNAVRRGSATFTFTRNLAAYYTNSDGTLTSFAIDTARIGDRGLLVEGARTNSLLRSQEWDAANGAWSPVNGTFSQNTTAAPNGTTTADSVLSGSTATDSFGSDALGAVVVASTRHTLSAYLKEGDEGPWVYLGHRDVTNAVHRELAWFNLSTGAKGTTGGTGTVHDYGIEVLANGWHRCWMSITTQAGEVALNVRILKASGDGVTTDATISGNTLYYGWGAQVEAGNFPSSYIPTTTVAVERPADAAAITGVATAAWFNSTGWTIVAEVAQDTAVNDSGVVAALYDTASSNYDNMRRNGASGFEHLAYTAGATVASVTGGSWPAITATKAAIATALNDFVLAVAGANVGTPDTTGAIPTSLDELQIGSMANANYLFGYIRRINFYRRRLPDTQLKNLTG